MAKINYEAIKAGLEDILQYSSSSADKLAIFPRQGLGNNYLSQVAFKAKKTLELFNGETTNDRDKRERFFANQLSLLGSGSEPLSKPEVSNNVAHSGKLEPTIKS
jgi:hypothetical protein